MDKHLITLANEQSLETSHKSLISLKEKISEDILSCELGFLYHQKIYGEDVELVNELFFKLSKRLDEILNHNFSVTINALDEAYGELANDLTRFYKNANENKGIYTYVCTE
jgi:hypothetical protein